jgi:F-type H+-transporting ATPase subunit b
LLSDACREEGGEAGIKSAFELGKGERERIGAAVRQVLGEDARLSFDTDPGLICGVALLAGGRRLGWSVDSYLDELQTRMDEALGAGAGAK